MRRFHNLPRSVRGGRVPGKTADHDSANGDDGEGQDIAFISHTIACRVEFLMVPDCKEGNAGRYSLGTSIDLTDEVMAPHGENKKGSD